MNSLLDPILNVKDVTAYKGSEKILNKFCLDIMPGEHTAIVGPNGCGKSTLLQVISAEIDNQNQDGFVRIGGREWHNDRTIKNYIGIVSNAVEPTLHDMVSGREIVLSGFLAL